MQQHNYLAILVAAIVAFLIGGLWYSPMLFAKQWMAAHAHTPEDVAKMKADAPRAYAISFVAFLVMASILQLPLFGVRHRCRIPPRVSRGDRRHPRLVALSVERRNAGPRIRYT